MMANSHIAPMQATHQELGLANGRNLSQYLSLNYSGVPGLLAGAERLHRQGRGADWARRIARTSA